MFPLRNCTCVSSRSSWLGADVLSLPCITACDGHIRVTDAAAARLPRTSPLRCFRPGIRVTKGLRFASFHVFVQWHGARFSSQKERIARMASNMLSARAPRVTRCTRASSALACRAGDFLYTRSCVLPVALAYVFGGASLCAGGVLLLACCNTVLPHALNLPPGFGLAAFALLAATLRPMRYGFCCGTKWMPSGCVQARAFWLSLPASAVLPTLPSSPTCRRAQRVLLGAAEMCPERVRYCPSAVPCCVLA